MRNVRELRRESKDSCFGAYCLNIVVIAQSLIIM